MKKSISSIADSHYTQRRTNVRATAATTAEQNRTKQKMQNGRCASGQVNQPASHPVDTMSHLIDIFERRRRRQIIN